MTHIIGEDTVDDIIVHFFAEDIMVEDTTVEDTMADVVAVFADEEAVAVAVVDVAREA